jgi:hypothetical protein
MTKNSRIKSTKEIEAPLNPRLNKSKDGLAQMLMLTPLPSKPNKKN